MHIDSQSPQNLAKIVADTGIDVPLVAVYCGARQGNHPIYTQVGYELGQALAQNKMGLVYGGACIGVMGAVADGVLDNQGTAVGVIPTFLLQKEVAHEGLNFLYTTDTMHTRKALMEQFASAFVVLAGGLGTLEEIMEVATWGQLNHHNKPMIIINTDGFYTHLIAHLEHTANLGFMRQEDLDNLIICTTPQHAIEILKMQLRVGA